jgi:hypothetical protein
MRLARWQVVVLATEALAIVVMFPGIQWRGEHYTCHHCRARARERKVILLGQPVRLSWTLLDRGRGSLGHSHDWWRQSHSYCYGLGGVAGGAACHTDGLYKDEQHWYRRPVAGRE